MSFQTTNDFFNIKAIILKLLEEKYPDIYSKLNLQDTSFINFLIDVQSYLTESELYYLSSVLKESFIATAQQPESILWHAYTEGYKPKLAVPAHGLAELIIPVQDLNTGKYINTAFEYDITKDTELAGAALRKEGVVNFRPKYNYNIKFINWNTLVKIEDNNIEKVGTFRRTSYNFAGNLYDAIAVPIEVHQITSVEQIEETVSYYSGNYNFPTVELPINYEDITRIAELEVYVNGEKIEYQPIVALFDKDKYNYTIRFGDTPVILLSNGVFGKKVLRGSKVTVNIYYTEGLYGGIKDNSLVFKQVISDKISENVLSTYAFVHTIIDNGRFTEDYESIRINTLRTKRSRNVAVTAQDYVDLVKKEFSDVEIFPINRATELNVNEVGLYLAFLKSTGVDNKEFFKTDTKALILSNEDLDNYALKSGAKYIIPSSLILKEIQNDPYYTKILETINLDNLPTSSDDLWIPIFTYEIDTNTGLVRSIFNPITYSYTPSNTFIKGVYRGLIYNLDFTPVSISLNTSQSNAIFYDLKFAVKLTFENTNAALETLKKSPVTDWLKIDLKDIRNAIDYEINSTDPNNNSYFSKVEFSTDEFGKTIVIVESSVKIPYNKIEEQSYNLDVEVYFKLPSKSNFTYSIGKTIYNNVYLKYDFTAYTSAKMENTNSGYILYDIPVFSIYELISLSSRAPSSIDNINNLFFDSFRRISEYLSDRSIITVRNNCLLAKTFGTSSLFKDSNGNPIGIKIPIEFEIEITIDPAHKSKDSIIRSVKEAIKRYINSKSGFLVSITRLDIYKAISNVEGVINANVIKPSTDLIYKIPSLNTIPRDDFVSFVPEFFYTTDDSIKVIVKNS